MLDEYYDKEKKILTIPDYFNEELNNVPTDTKLLFFNEDVLTLSQFNNKVGHQGCTDAKCPRNLPNSITHLIFGAVFNQKVNKLPTSLTHLHFGSDFNQAVDNLPDNLTHLIFGYNFDRTVDNLPNSLTHLIFGYKFNQKVYNLPNNLKYLTFEYTLYNNPIDNLPKSIVLLSFSCKCNIINYLPEFIENIKILFYENDVDNTYIENIPYHIKTIRTTLKKKKLLFKKNSVWILHYK